jgi:hypothetical protein
VQCPLVGGRVFSWLQRQTKVGTCGLFSCSRHPQAASMLLWQDGDGLQQLQGRAELAIHMAHICLL